MLLDVVHFHPWLDADIAQKRFLDMCLEIATLKNFLVLSIASYSWNVPCLFKFNIDLCTYILVPNTQAVSTVDTQPLTENRFSYIIVLMCKHANYTNALQYKRAILKLFY